MTNNEEIQSENAQEMTEAIYNVHSTVNEAVMGQILNNTEQEESKGVEGVKGVKGEERETVEDVDMEPESENLKEEGDNINKTEDSEDTVNEVITFSTNTVNPQLVKEQLKYCQRILKGLKRHRDAGPFLLPVDPVALAIPDYFDVIKQPMDLGTISKKCDLNEYGSAEAFMSDVRLMLTNCFTYNAPDTQVTKMGRSLEKYFNTSMAKMPTDLGHGTGNGVTSVTSSASSSIESPASRPKRESVVSGVSGSVRRPSSPSGSMTFCSSVLRELMKKTNSHLNWPFMLPVDPIALSIPDYFDVIKQPMDLGTIRKKIDTGMYSRPEQFESDVRLVFSNCYAYNPPESDVYRMAQQLEAIFEQKINQKPSPKLVEKSSAGTNSAVSSVGSSSSLQGHGHHGHAGSTSSFIPSSASQLIPGLDSLEDDSEKILAINHQIQILQAELNYLLLNRKSSSSTSVGSVSKSSGASGPSGTSSVAKPKKKPTTTPLNKASSSVSVPVSVINEEMSFEEKRQLSEDVSNLPQENMMRVLEIIQEFMPNLHSNGDSDVIELDIEALDVRTLRALQNYIWECQNPGKKRKSLPKGSNNANNANKKLKDQSEINNNNNPIATTTNNNNNNNNNYDSSSSSSSEDDD